MYKTSFARPLLILVFCILVTITGCGSQKDGGSDQEPPVISPPRVLVPEAPGEKVLGTSPLTLDISRTDQGYFVARAEAGSRRINIQMCAPDGVLYSYFVEPGEDAVLPFSGGSGNYLVTCYQQVSGSQYAALCSESLDVSLENEFLPYIYPNQYVDFSPESEVSRQALSMLEDDATDIQALDAIYTFVTERVTYDTEKARTIEAGYLPDVDETLECGTGICFDYAALTAAMLRSRDIPCKLQIGYAGDIKHAWIDVYIRSKGWVEKAVVFDGETWTRMDPTFDSSSDDKEQIQSYIGDGDNYTVQFTR
ncbi:MAG: transglutaminase-like domain-containing protein [Eubacteriales bacterium]|nr:transglutaminase-like domain-containing protein [Eubacteriales bacterium]